MEMADQEVVESQDETPAPEQGSEDQTEQVEYRHGLPRKRKI